MVDEKETKGTDSKRFGYSLSLRLFRAEGHSFWPLGHRFRHALHKQPRSAWKLGVPSALPEINWFQGLDQELGRWRLGNPWCWMFCSASSFASSISRYLSSTITKTVTSRQYREFRYAPLLPSSRPF